MERKLNVDKTFRRRSGRLLNVSGTISLHPGPGVKKNVIQNTMSKINFNSTFATDPITAFNKQIVLAQKIMRKNLFKTLSNIYGEYFDENTFTKVPL